MLKRGRGNLGIEVIGGFKLLKAALLLAAAIVLPIFGKHQVPLLFWLAQHVSVDPNAHFFRGLVDKFIQLSPKFPLISVGMGIYAVIFAIEGTGLVLRKGWAEYLTIIVTASFLPLEIYEMVRHTTVIKGVVIALNIVIVAYLWRRVRARRHQKHDVAHHPPLAGVRAWLRKSSLSRARQA
jgi:uncharacterized membrane protein (DUF2068 family)